MKSSLDSLHPIYIPPEVGFFPLSEGCIALLFFITSIFVSFMAFRVVAFRKNRFKREAIKELKQKRKKFQERDVFELLKRVALSCDTREKVASLSGEEFLKYFSLETNAVIQKAHNSVYDKNIVLSEDERNELYKLTLASIQRVEYVRD
ncbi:MAG: DUF4381 domain-containing protein [Campylobacterota bacterium]|nr:DUF4381 domain-containing protein [Campylobacterota bacterium]